MSELHGGSVGRGGLIQDHQSRLTRAATHGVQDQARSNVPAGARPTSGTARRSVGVAQATRGGSSGDGVLRDMWGLHWQRAYGDGIAVHDVRDGFEAVDVAELRTRARGTNAVAHRRAWLDRLQ